MSTDTLQQKLESLAKELAKDIKTESDRPDLSRRLLKLTVETALGAEAEAHVGYAKHDVSGRNTGNRRNGYSIQTVIGDHGDVEIAVPRDRNSTFEPQLTASIRPA